MAANNYYGFTHAGTQYGTQYTAATNNIPVAAAAAAAAGTLGTTQYPQYSTGQGIPSSQGYGNVTVATDQANYAISGYTRALQQASTAPQTQQAYYTTTPTNTLNSGQQPVYSTLPLNSGTSTPGYQGYLQPVPIQSQTPQASTSTAVPTTPKATSFTNYDAAVYNAVSAFAQGGGRPHGGGGGGGYKRGAGAGAHYGNKMKGMRPMSNKPLTLHYCDVCKISCAGPQTYKEHLDGQKHKKKEMTLKTSAQPVTKGTPVGLRCELCDVVCTGSDAYAAHIRGAKHQKVLKLHTKLGKPIPSDNPQVVASSNAPLPSAPKQKSNSSNNSKANSNAAGNNNSFKKPMAPAPIAISAANSTKISFIGPKDADRFLSTTPGAKASDENATMSTSYPPSTVSAGTAGTSTSMMTGNKNAEQNTKNKTSSSTPLEFPDRDKDIQPVGQDYIEEIRTDDGKGISFNCKLCDCKFNDPNAKEMHMKGRRHRLQYKKKVNPDLVVDMKPSSRQKKMEERRPLRPGLGSRREPPPMGMGPMGAMKQRSYYPNQGYQSQYHYPGENYQNQYPYPNQNPNQNRYQYRQQQRHSNYNAGHRYPHGPPRPLFPPMPQRNFGPSPPNFAMFNNAPIARRPDSVEDRHVMAKHAEIYPTEEELQAIQKIVSATEKALKFVSDTIAEDDATKAAEQAAAESLSEVKTEPPETAPGEDVKPVVEPVKKPRTEAELQAHRTLKGVMRVGDLAKGLLLKGDRSVHLVVLLSVKPTVTLLNRVYEALPKHLQTISPDETYNLSNQPENAAVVISSSTEPKIEVLVTITSPLLRSGPVPAPADPAAGEATATTEADPDDLLDKNKCLDALAALRHAKWFQARATAIQSCVILIRVLREVGKRVPAWHCLSPWAIELLTEKSISTTGPVSPGDGLRLIMEVIASGVILPHGPGILDPCEKDPTDALSSLSAQGREDVTLYAQQALREIQFGLVHKVLGIEEIKDQSNNTSRKRRRDNSAGGEVDESGSASTDKKDKKESETEEGTTDAAATSNTEMKTEPAEPLVNE